MTDPLPRTVKTLVKRLAPGWTHQVTTGAGTVVVTYLGDPRGDGTRPKLTRDAPCTSIALRARHTDGRAAAAVWVRPEGKPYALDMAWRWTVCQADGCRPAEHPGEVPAPLDAATLAAWLAAPTSDLAVSTHGPTDLRSAA